MGFLDLGTKDAGIPDDAAQAAEGRTFGRATASAFFFFFSSDDV